MYETFYGLTGKPFQLNPDPAFLFASKGHSSAYAYLKYGVFQGEGFIVVTGEIGAGKTTLVRALLQLNIITDSGDSFVLPQHWVNVFVGGVLISAVLIDIWVRQANLYNRLRLNRFQFRRRSRPIGEPPHA